VVDLSRIALAPMDADVIVVGAAPWPDWSPLPTPSTPSSQVSDLNLILMGGDDLRASCA
jgi:hypothetical protein